mmetsp:Transcript_144832/g.252534  ORF Transcript_144832/g.252534 Transcript_144832/m.252534 type:complete len:248 (-) Transcript_144832:739-1482(-)
MARTPSTSWWLKESIMGSRIVCSPSYSSPVIAWVATAAIAHRNRFQDHRSWGMRLPTRLCSACHTDRWKLMSCSAAIASAGSTWASSPSSSALQNSGSPRNSCGRVRAYAMIWGSSAIRHSSATPRRQNAAAVGVEAVAAAIWSMVARTSACSPRSPRSSKRTPRSKGMAASRSPARAGNAAIPTPYNPPKSCRRPLSSTPLARNRAAISARASGPASASLPSTSSNSLGTAPSTLGGSPWRTRYFQ